MCPAGGQSDPGHLVDRGEIAGVAADQPSDDRAPIRPDEHDPGQQLRLSFRESGIVHR